MRNRISGIVGIVLGGWIVSGPLRGDAIASGDGAYATGQYVGFGMGVLMLLAGFYYLTKGDDPLTRKKKKKPNSFRPPAPPPPLEL